MRGHKSVQLTSWNGKRVLPAGDCHAAGCCRLEQKVYMYMYMHTLYWHAYRVIALNPT